MVNSNPPGFAPGQCRHQRKFAYLPRFRSAQSALNPILTVLMTLDAQIGGGLAAVALSTTAIGAYRLAIHPPRCSQD